MHSSTHHMKGPVMQDSDPISFSGQQNNFAIPNRPAIRQIGWIAKTPKGIIVFGGWSFESGKSPVALYTESEMFEIAARWREFGDEKGTMPEGVLEEVDEQAELEDAERWMEESDE